MSCVRDILRSKGSEVWSIGPDAMVIDALRLMAERNAGALLVMEGDHLVGVLSERDHARKVDLFGRSSRTTPVRDVMTKRVVYVRPEETAEQCMALMTDKRVRHLPVVHDGRVVGVISIGDVVKNVISDKEFIIEQLERYITGQR